MKTTRSKRMLALLMAALLMVNNLSSLQTYASAGEEQIPAAASEEIVPETSAEPVPVAEPEEEPATEPAKPSQDGEVSIGEEETADTLQPDEILIPGEDVASEEETLKNAGTANGTTYTVTESQGGASVVIKWNDNKNDFGKPGSENMAARPSSDAYYQNNCVLQVSLDNGEWVNLTSDNTALLEELGLTAMPVPTKSEEATQWKVTYSNLPSKVQEKITTGEAPDQQTQTIDHTVRYRVVESKTNPINGYMIPTYKVGNQEGITELTNDAIPTEIMNTVKDSWKGDIYWFDNQNAYSTRPSTSDFVVKRYILGQDRSTAVDVTGEVGLSVSSQEYDTYTDWTYSLTNAPAYAPDSNAYVYFLEPRDAIKEELSQNTKNGDSYVDTYYNVDNNIHEDGAIFNHGYLSALIQNTTKFSFKKVWEDEGQDPANRPACTVYLMRIAEGPGGVVNTDALSNSGAVEGHDKKPVPRNAAEGSVIGQTDKGQDIYLIEFTPGDDTLPMYDTQGRRYVYYATELGLDSSYIQQVDNSANEKADQFAGTKYILDGATLINDRQTTVNMAATKQFNAAALQSMSGTVVTYKLESKYYGAAGEEEWKDADPKYVANEESDALKDVLHTDNGIVTIDITGFTNEEMTITSPPVEVYRHDPDTGALVEYRWVEVSMDVNGSGPKPVPEYRNVDDTVIVNAGEILPGVGSNKTTALLEPRQVNDTTVVNSIHAETQIKVFKTWSDADGNDITGDWEAIQKAYPGVSTLTFSVTRSDGASTTNGTLKDVNGNTVSAIELPIDSAYTHYDQAAHAWVASLNDLERFNPATGAEYTYKLNEDTDGNWKSMYTHTFIVTGDDDDASVKVTEQDAFFHNGPPEGLQIGVEKKYLDDSDLISRQPVVVGVFRKDTGAEVARTTLNEQNGWWDLIGFTDVVGNEDINDYVVKEISVGSMPVNYTKDAAAIYTQATSFPGYGSYGNAVGSVVSSAANDLYYNYNVYIEASNNNSVYTVYNQRVGVVNLKLTKEWIAGSHDGLGAVFEVRRNGQKVVLASGQVEVSAKADIQVISQVKDGNIAVSAPNAKGSYSINIDISNLEKYDPEGKMYEYTLHEVNMLENVNPININQAEPREINNNSVTIGTDHFNVSIGETDRDIKTKAEHHTGDVYTWRASNTLSDTIPLTANKVWRDDNDSRRPDVTFDLYRVSEKQNPLLTQLLDGVLANRDTLAAEVSHMNAEKLAGRRLWDTTHNNWYWSVDLGSFPKYDGEGYRYVYFLKENYTSYQGLYTLGYYNGTETPKDGDQISTKEVFDIDKDEFVKTVCILADGKNEYSKTTVNYRQDTRTISGRKLWKLPDGWNFTNQELPNVKISLYRTLAQVPDSYTQAEIITYKNSHSTELVYVFDLNANKDGVYNFKTDVDKDGHELTTFDDFGRRYQYFLIEGTEEDGFKEIQNFNKDQVRINANTFMVENTYTYDEPHVKITVNKEWSSSVQNKNPQAYFRITLYGKTGNNTIRMGYAILRPTDSSVTFEYIYTEKDILHGNPDFSQANRLPLYGPDGKEIKYYVTESIVGGYTCTPPAAGTSAENPIKLTSNAAGTEYTGSVKYKNDYDGDTVDFAVEKVWADETVQVGGSNSSYSTTEYRPASLTLTIRRSWDAKTIEGTSLAGGDEAVYKADGTTPLTMVLTSANDYKAKVTGLEKYAPNGALYNYYAVTETGTTVDDQTKLDNYYTIKKIKNPAGVSESKSNSTAPSASSETDTDKVTNTLQTVSVSGSKTWAVKDGNMTAEIWNRLYELGALPKTVWLVPQRRAPGGNWEYLSVTSGSSYVSCVIDGKNVVSKKYDVAKTTNNTVPSYSVTFSKLPKYVNGTTDPYEYRVVEVLKWGDNIPLSIYDGNGSNLLTYDTSKFNPEEASLTVSGTTYAYTNKIPMVTLKMNKEWIDGENEYLGRPNQVTVKINNNANVKCTISTVEDASHTSGTILLPMPKGGATAAAMNATYDNLVEDAIKNYINNNISSDIVDRDGSLEFDLQNEFRVADVYVAKTWTKNEEETTLTADQVNTYITNGTLPTSLEFTLYTWEGDNKDAATIATDKDGNAIVITQSMASLATGVAVKVKTGESLKAFKRETDGTQTKINYEFRETAAIFGTGTGAKKVAISSDGTFAGVDSMMEESDYTLVAGGNASTASSVTGSFNNDVITKSLTATKSWKNGATGQTLDDWATFDNLRTLGALPVSVTFELQRRSTTDTPGTWTNVETLGAKYADGTAIKNTEYKVGDLTAATYNDMHASYADLPLSQNLNGTVYNYEYRIAETLTWAGGSTSTYYEGADSNQLAPANGTFAPETADVSVANNAYAFTNSIPLLKMRLKKIWIDNSDELGLRVNEDLDVTVTQKVTGGAGVECVIKPVAAADGKTADEWESDVYYLPYPAGTITDMAAYLTGAYTVAEEAIDNYVQVHAEEFEAGSNNVYVYTLENELHFSKVIVYKNWADADGNDLDASTISDLVDKKVLPDKLKFQLFSYTDDAENAAAVKMDGKDVTTTFGVKALAEAADNGIEWKLEDLPAFDADGNQIHYIAKEIAFVYGTTEYDPEEVEGVNASGAGEATSTEEYFADAGSYYTELFFDNEVETDSVSASKEWINSVTDGQIDWPVFQKLIEMKVLPQAITFVLQRSANGGTFEDIESVKGTELDGTALKNLTYVLYGNMQGEAVTKDNFQSMKASWDNLPKSANEADGTTKNYTYRVAEKLTWSDGTTSIYESGASASLQMKGSEFAAETATLNVDDNNTYAFSNEIALLKIEVKKTWIDNEDENARRPETLGYKVEKVSDKVSITGKITEETDWTSDAIYVPAPAKAETDYSGYLANAYKVLEDAIAEYAQTNAEVFEKNNDVYSYNLINELRMKSIDVEKIWTKNGEKIDAATVKQLVDQKMIPDKLRFQLFSYVGDAEPTPVKVDGKDVTADFAVKDLADGAQTWLTDLPVYQVSGEDQVEIYYLAKEIGYIYGTTVTELSAVDGITAADDATAQYGKDHTTAEVSFTNNILDKGLSASKIWKNSVTGEALDYATYQNLIKLGVLPQSITFVVQRKSGDGEWADITKLSDGHYMDGTPVENVTYALASAGENEYNNRTASWNNLPASGTLNGAGVNYSYRVIEELKWANNSTSRYINDTESSNQLYPMNNTYAPETASVEVTDSAYAFTNSIPLLKIELKKVWIDGDANDELRPDTLGTTIKTVSGDVAIAGTLSAANSWEDAYYLPAPAQTMTDYSAYLTAAYQVLEDEVDDYVEVTKKEFEKNGSSYVYTLKNEQRVTEISVEKSWENSTGELNKAAIIKLQMLHMLPAYLKFQLYSYVGDADPTPVKVDGNDVTATYDVLKLADGKQKMAVDLPAYVENADGTQSMIHYTVKEIAYVYYGKETPAADYSGIELKDSETTRGETDVTVSFTNKLLDTEVSAAKTWINSLTGEAVDWATFQNLLKLGVLPESITFVVQRSKDGGKNWVDMEAVLGIDMAGELVKNEKLVLAQATEATYNNFTAEWKNLPVSAYDAETEGTVNYTYRVEEVLTWADGTTSKYHGEGSNKLAPANGAYAPEEAKLTISGTAFNYSNTIRLLKIDLKKIWLDNKNADGLRPDVLGTVIERINDKVTIEGTITAADADPENWTEGYYLPAPKDATDLVKYLNEEYGVYEDLDTATAALETAIANYVQTNAGEFKANDDGSYSWTFENEEELTKVYVTKEWTTSEGNELDEDEIAELVELGTLPESIRFVLYTWTGDAVETAAPYVDAAGKGVEATYNYEDLFETQQIDVNLPVWDAAGNRLNYEMREVELIYTDDNKAAVEKDNSDTDRGVNISADSTNPSYRAGELATEIENELVTASITVEKHWDDSDKFINDEELGLRPETIDVTLYRDGEQYGDTVQLTRVGRWSYTWNDLPVYQAGSDEKSVWTIKEYIDDEHQTYYVAKPVYTPAFAENIETVDGEETEAGEAADADETTAETVTLADGETTKLEILNTWVTVDIHGQKHWDDDNDRDGVRPESITITLLGDELFDEYETYVRDEKVVTPDENGDWYWEFGNLPKYGEDGHIISYTVLETLNYPADDPELDVEPGTELTATADPADGVLPGDDPADEEPALYEITIHDPVINGTQEDGNEEVVLDVTNFHAPELIEIPVEKKWDDKNDKDRIRPNAITVKLYADGVDTGVTLELTKKNGWKGNFTDLFKYRDHGVEIVYTVKEVAVKGYSCKYEGDQYVGFKLTNHHTPNPKTADRNGNMSLWMTICTAAMAVMLAMFGKRRKYCR